MTASLLCTTAPASTESPEIEIFRAGDYGAKGRYSDSDLQQIADDYAPGRLEAPLTLDHAQTGPAHGWVESLRAAGGSLFARICRLGESIRRLVQDGAYRRCSIELLRNHPATGRPYLRAVTLLGAASPAVEGLEPVRFTDDARPLVFAEPRPDPPAPAAADPLIEELEALRLACFRHEVRALLDQAERDGSSRGPDAEDCLAAFAAEHGFTARPAALLALLRKILLPARNPAARPAVPEGPASPTAFPGHTATTVPFAQPPSHAQHARAFADHPAPDAILHGQALRLMGLHPGLPYAQALIHAARH